MQWSRASHCPSSHSCFTFAPCLVQRPLPTITQVLGSLAPPPPALPRETPKPRSNPALGILPAHIRAAENTASKAPALLPLLPFVLEPPGVSDTFTISFIWLLSKSPVTHAARPRVSSQPASHLTLEGLRQTTLFSALIHTPPGHPTFLVSLRGAPSHLLCSFLPFLSSLSTPVLHPSTPPTGFHLFQSFTTLRSTHNSEEPGSSWEPSSKLPALPHPSTWSREANTAQGCLLAHLPHLLLPQSSPSQWMGTAFPVARCRNIGIIPNSSCLQTTTQLFPWNASSIWPVLAALVQMSHHRPLQPSRHESPCLHLWPP